MTSYFSTLSNPARQGTSLKHWQFTPLATDDLHQSATTGLASFTQHHFQHDPNFS
jgi:hypothetical protein